MVQAPASASTPPRPRPRWQVPLLAGLCFGLGYGLTHRLLALQWPSLVRLGQGFEVRPFPGTSLESLRLRFGADSQEVRGTLDLLELERQTGADKSPAQPEARPTAEAEARLTREELEAASELPADPELAAPRADAPPPPQLPGADQPQPSPEVGPR
jgi:hypothetical protein